MWHCARANKLPQYWCPQDLKAVLLNKVEPYDEMTEKSQKFLNILQRLSSVDRLELSQCHYLQLLKLGLYLEEYQRNVDSRKYNMYGQKIQFVHDKLYKIYIRDIEKDHPLHNGCYLVELIDCKDTSKTNFCESYQSSQVFNIRFRSNSYPFRCGHYALSLTSFYKMTPYLFPSKTENTDSQKVLPADRETWFNEQIAENPEQKQGVLNIIGKSSFPTPYIIYGPPGTGKTATLVEAICQIYQSTSENVLVCAPSNAAADVITQRLLKYLPSMVLGRMFSPSRDTNLIETEVKVCSNLDDYGKIIQLNCTLVRSKRVVICTLCTCTRLLFLNLPIKFGYVFIDEAGQSTEPESLIAFTAINLHGSPRCQIVISGDPQQLGPAIRSKYAAPILGQSILERLMKLELYKKSNDNNYNFRYITKLLRNYRSHPIIIHVPNELYYDNELLACNDKCTFASNKFPVGFPVIFHAVYGQELRENNSTSSYNEAEAAAVLKYVRLLLGEKVGDKAIAMKDIGIVTPFAAQSNHLRRCLKAHNLTNVTAGTVEIFQGQEKDVIIVSTVRSRTFVHEQREHIGFLSNARRFNVALTRAKAVLVVIGNPTVLQTDVNWRHFLRFCQNNNACRGEAFDLMDGNDAKDAVAKKSCATSADLFSETLNVLRLGDGINRQKGNHFNRFLFSAARNQNCSIL
ncbi:putative helicase MOV-10 isoform X2 [Phymastichus coffea]|uniref:putative helicase MOV-10 isoform X2 n=1 Tax=Phymastichus coffea TaxID=108790 RepID=UPI00273B81B8|nr:putative helicase MOV-10 isoform X2 [Phymastichus coffea]